MRPMLMWVLAASLGLTVWMASQDEGDTVAPTRTSGRARAGTPDDGGPGASTHAQAPQGRPATLAGRAASPQGGSSARAAGAIDPGDAQRVQLAVARWQDRLAQGGAAATPIAAAMAHEPAQGWAAMRPPPPPPRVVEVAAPPPPMAPAFPHRWLGRMNDEAPALNRAIVAGPQSTWVVREGDVIEGQWRVDKIQDRSMQLTYLPLQQSQTVTMR